MPFMFHSKPYNIERISKRDHNDIHTRMLMVIETFPINYGSTDGEGKIIKGTGAKNINLLPVTVADPPRKKADPNKFLVLKALEQGLSWYETEIWLDQICLRDQYQFQLQTGSIVHIDETRVWYHMSDFHAYSAPSNFMIVRSQ